MANFIIVHRIQFCKGQRIQCIHCDRAGGHDLTDKHILHLVRFKVVETEDGVKPLAEFLLVVLVLGQVSAWGTARDRSTFKCLHARLRICTIDASKPDLRL